MSFINSRPRFRLMGVIGDGVSSVTPLTNDRYSIQCSARFKVEYRLIGEKLIAKNARG